MFHRLVTKTLYTTNQESPDTCTSVDFLITKVRETHKDYWGNIFHIIKYIRKTIYLPLILSANGSGFLKWWIDAYYAVHPNMRVNTCGGISMGIGFPIMKSTKQNLNTRSSTESEIIGIHE